MLTLDYRIEINMKTAGGAVSEESPYFANRPEAAGF